MPWHPFKALAVVKPWKSVPTYLYLDYVGSLNLYPSLPLGRLDPRRFAHASARDAGHSGASAQHLFPYPPAAREGSREAFTRERGALCAPEAWARHFAFAFTGDCEEHTRKLRVGLGGGCRAGNAASHRTAASRAVCIATRHGSSACYSQRQVDT
jgi:hypothetical protein